MARQTRAQKRTVERVMHEFKHGTLRSGGRRKVRNPKQAIAIALSEAGASRRAPAPTRARRKPERRRASGRELTRAELYERAKRRKIPGRSRMTKVELARALGV